MRVLFFVFLVSQMAEAQTFDPFMLAERSIPVPSVKEAYSPVIVETRTGGLKFICTDGKIEIVNKNAFLTWLPANQKQGSCDQILTGDDPESVTLTFVIKGKEVSTSLARKALTATGKGLLFSVDDTKKMLSFVKADGAFAPDENIVFRLSIWMKGPATGVQLSDNQFNNLSDNVSVFYRDAAGIIFQSTAKKRKNEQVATLGWPPPENWDCLDDAEVKREFPKSKELAEEPLYCIEVTGTSANLRTRVAHKPDEGRTVHEGFIVPPNRTVVFAIRRSIDQRINFKVTGAAGFSEKSKDDQAQSGTDRVNWVTDIYYVSPREAAKSTDVTIQVGAQGGDFKPAEERVVQLVTDKLYSGVITIGIGFQFGAFAPQYSLRDIPGSSLKEVTASGVSSFATDIVIGFAPYLFNCGSGGVSAANPPPVIVAPYIGLGIVGYDGKNISALRSYYLGFELEFGRFLSVVFSYVLRRIDVLPKGVAVGSPVSDSTVPIINGWGHGFGLIVNLAPEVFKFGGLFK